MWYTYLRVKLAVLLKDERGDLSTYLAQGILALAALSLTGVVMLAFSDAGQKLSEIVNQWLAVPIHAQPPRTPPRQVTTSDCNW